MASAVVVRDGAAIVFCSCGLPVPREVIAVAVCKYLRYGVSDRDVEELPAERGVVVDHARVYWWVQTSRRSSSTQTGHPRSTRSTAATNSGNP